MKREITFLATKGVIIVVYCLERSQNETSRWDISSGLSFSKCKLFVIITSRCKLCSFLNTSDLFNLAVTSNTCAEYSSLPIHWLSDPSVSFHSQDQAVIHCTEMSHFTGWIVLKSTVCLISITIFLVLNGPYIQETTLHVIMQLV